MSGQEVRWVPMTSEDARMCATLSARMQELGYENVAHALQALADGYNDCYLEDDPHSAE